MARFAVKTNEKVACRLVPTADVPGGIETIGGPGQSGDKGDDRMRGFLFGRTEWIVGIAAPGQFEQVGAFRACQRKRARQPPQGLGGRTYLAALLDPSHPGDPDPRALGQFLAPETGCAAAAAGSRGCRHAFTPGANEGAKQLALFFADHG